MGDTLSIGAVIGDGFAILRRGSATLAVLAALLLGLPRSLPWMTEAAVPGDAILAGGAAGAAGILRVVFNIAFDGAATHTALAAAEERPGSVPAAAYGCSSARSPSTSERVSGS